MDEAGERRKGREEGKWDEERGGGCREERGKEGREGRDSVSPLTSVWACCAGGE